MFIKIPEELVRQMHEFALTRDEFLAELLGIVIDRYDANPPKYATLADLARQADSFRERMNRDSSSVIAGAAENDRDPLVSELAERLPAV